MPQRKFSSWLDGYLEFTRPTEAPEAFNYWVAVWTLGGALRRKVFIDMGHFQWIPNFYVFLVAPPGIVNKSTCLNIGASMLRDIPGINFGPEALTWQALVESLGKSREEIPIQLNGEQMFFPMSCVSISAGELGTLIEPRNRDMIDALVSLWDGKVGAWEKWTKTSGSDIIINPFVNIASGTTPAWLAQNFPEELVGGGFTSRCVFVYGEEKRNLIAYPSRALPENFKRLRSDLVHDLELISTLSGEFTITPAAFEYGERWYSDHYSQETKLELDRFAGYRARKQTHIHKLAMIISAAERDDLVIDEDILKRAEAQVSAIEPSMKRVFESIGLEGPGRRLNLLVSVLHVFSRMTKEALFNRVAFKMSSEEYDQAIVAGARAGILGVEQDGASIYVKLRER